MRKKYVSRARSSVIFTWWERREWNVASRRSNKYYLRYARAAGLIGRAAAILSGFTGAHAQTRELLTSSLLFLSHVELEQERARPRSAANGLHYSGRCPIKEFLKLVLLSLLRASARDPHYWRIVRDVKWISHGRLTSLALSRISRPRHGRRVLRGRAAILAALGPPILTPCAPDVIIRGIYRGAEA